MSRFFFLNLSLWIACSFDIGYCLWTQYLVPDFRAILRPMPLSAGRLFSPSFENPVQYFYRIYKNRFFCNAPQLWAALRLFCLFLNRFLYWRRRRSTARLVIFLIASGIFPSYAMNRNRSYSISRSFTISSANLKIFWCISPEDASAILSSTASNTSLEGSFLLTGTDPKVTRFDGSLLIFPYQALVF